MALRRSRSEITPYGSISRRHLSKHFDDAMSQHSTLDSIYSKNSIIRKEDDSFERHSYKSRKLQCPYNLNPKTQSIYSDFRRSRSVADARLEYENSGGDSGNRSLYSCHSVRSVFQRAQDNYQTIIGNSYPLSKVIDIWKALSDIIEQQLKADKSTVIPKLGVFTIIETNLQGYIHKKPVLVINKSLLEMYDLKSKDYGITKAVQRCALSYLDIANKCALNRFIVEEVISEVIKSFEKLLMTKKNSELPFFKIGKLQVLAGEIRMKFYEDFINTLNRYLFRSQSGCSLVSGISKLSRTSSVLSKMTSLSGCYKPSPEFCSVLPIFTGETTAEAKKMNGLGCKSQIRKSQSCCSLESRRTKDTQSLLSVPCGSISSKRSCCSQRPSRGAHGDACMCIVCENRLRGAALNDLGNRILQGQCEVERRKDALIGRTSKVNEIESRERLEFENKSKNMQADAAKYNGKFANEWTGRRPKRSRGSQVGNDLMCRRQNSECERRKHKLNNVEDIKAQIKEKKSREKCQKQIEEQNMKERNDKLTELLYEERIKNIKEKNCKRNQMKHGLDKQILDKMNKPKVQSVGDFDSQLLRKTPLRNDMSSLSQMQIQKGRYKNQGEYQKAQMKEKYLREQMERDEDYDYECKFVQNINDEMKADKLKDLKKRQELQAEQSALYKEAWCRRKRSMVLEPMGFILNNPIERKKCFNCARRVNWNNTDYGK